MIRLATGRSALFGAMLLVALVAFLPLRLVLGIVGLGDEGVAAREVTGSVWSGRLRDARFGEVALGDLHAHVAPLPLLAARARVELDTPGGTGVAPDGARGVQGAVTLTRHAVGIDDMTATLATGRVFAPLPVTGLDLDDATVRFRDGRCETAEGRVRATLAGEAGGVTLPASLSGPARCEAGALLLTLASQAGTETATLSIGGDGRYRAAFALARPDPAAVPRLQEAGFVADASGAYRLTVEGRF